MGRAGPLAGVRVIDLSRLAPGPYCTMLLADMGAEVIAVGGGRTGVAIPEFGRGKRQIRLDLKSAAGREALHRLVEGADVVVEGFRPGAAARIGADRETLAALNPRLVYCSLTGYGQTGPRAQEAGHDINYLALSGVLGAMGPSGEPPIPPLNLVADFAGGSLMAALGILAALLEARATGRGRHVDAAMIDGSLSLMAMHLPLWHSPWWPERGEGLLGGGAPFYRSYACADGKFVAVGAIEPPFFAALWGGLGLGTAPDHMDKDAWPAIEAALAEAFAQRPRDDWTEVFAGTDACVTPVLAPDEVWREPHFAARHPGWPAGTVPPAPRFGTAPPEPPEALAADCTEAVLAGLGLDPDEIRAAIGATAGVRPGLDWPPAFSGGGAD
ncbi:CaiB/BaiF CoA-transferase family protein [Rhodobacteraceae bacterium DSL-40]|uniref:CaiB/BaiF CoA transferase family protein n=1 Tax=Amaricoccus sp. B4 TaxID=3368557 RepID=UPI000DAD4F59